MQGLKFKVPPRYELGEVLGRGAFGVVCAAVDKETGQSVAIKKVSNVFHSIEACKRIYRELVLMRWFQCENVLYSEDMFLPPGSGASFQDVYCVMERMETTLKRVIESPQALPPPVVRYISYQLTCGLAYLHSAGVLHRDLKPENVLINSDVSLKIGDFGLSRVRTDHSPFMTGYVSTRWYRAPEIILTWSSYSLAIDLWSLGTVIAEVVLRRPIFPGTSFMHQVAVITSVVGSPTPDLLEHIPNPQAREYAINLGQKPRLAFASVFPGAPPELLDLLDRLLVLDPQRRPTAAQCLEHAYFAEIRDPEMEEVSETTFNFDFEKQHPTAEVYRQLILAEVAYFHPEVAQQLL